MGAVLAGLMPGLASAQRLDDYYTQCAQVITLREPGTPETTLTTRFSIGTEHQPLFPSTSDINSMTYVLRQGAVTCEFNAPLRSVNGTFREHPSEYLRYEVENTHPYGNVRCTYSRPFAGARVNFDFDREVRRFGLCDRNVMRFPQVQESISSYNGSFEARCERSGAVTPAISNFSCRLMHFGPGG